MVLQVIDTYLLRLFFFLALYMYVRVWFLFMLYEFQLEKSPQMNDVFEEEEELSVGDKEKS